MIFKKLHADAKEPVRSTAQSAGLDVFARCDNTIPIGGVELIKTGLTFETEGGDDNQSWFIDLRIRSSLALSGVMLANGAGVIDPDYAGNEIGVLLYNTTDEPYHIPKGEKIAQMLLMGHYSHLAKGVTFKYDERTGGFGSTS